MWTILGGWHIAIGFFMMLGFWVALVAIAVLIVRALFPDAHRSDPAPTVRTQNALAAQSEKESRTEDTPARVQGGPEG